MKALLLKDFYALKELKLLVLVGIMAALVIALGSDAAKASFIISYFTVVTAVLVVNTIAYDEMDNGYAFLFTLPVSRRLYVQEKYLFGLMTGLAGWIFAAILIAVTGGLSQISGAVLAVLFVSSLAVFLLIQSVMIPVQLKFGNQKGRLLVIVVLAACVGAGASLGSLIDFTEVSATFDDIGDVLTSALILTGSLLMLLISYKCSLRIMTRKEF